jgi:hypothetical protein
MGLLDAVIARGVAATGLQGQEEAFVRSAPDRVYHLVSDVTRMGEWSPECYRGQWMDGAVGPALGAGFKGYNRRGWLRWFTVCTVTEFEPGRVFTFDTRPRGGKTQSRWRYELDLVPGGTILRESFAVSWYLKPVVSLFFGSRQARLAQLREGMRETLQGIKAVAKS